MTALAKKQLTAENSTRLQSESDQRLCEMRIWRKKCGQQASSTVVGRWRQQYEREVK